MYSNNVLIMILYTDSVQGLPNVLIMVYWLQMKYTIMRFWFVFIYIYILTYYFLLIYKYK